MNPPPIPDNVFLHNLTSKGNHPRLIWEKRLPKKLNEQLYNSSDELPVGWGIHILEGPHWTNILWTMLVFLLISGLVTGLWSGLKHDIQGGAGLGSYLVTLLSVFIAWLTLKWSYR